MHRQTDTDRVGLVNLNHQEKINSFLNSYYSQRVHKCFNVKDKLCLFSYWIPSKLNSDMFLFKLCLKDFYYEHLAASSYSYIQTRSVCFFVMFTFVAVFCFWKREDKSLFLMNEIHILAAGNVIATQRLLFSHNKRKSYCLQICKKK